jgi:selenocysteine lyase/cysteine desulfurase
VSCDPHYKFFGPHLGVLYGRYDLLDHLRAYKVRPAENHPPDRFETGTKNHEGLAGTAAAVDYLAELGAEFGAPFADDYPDFEGRRLQLKTAMAAIRAYEWPLAGRLVAGLQGIPGMTLYGISDPARYDRRAPTVAFTLEGYTPRQVTERLGEEGIFVWDGNYYALAVTERLGVEESGAWCGWALPITTQPPRWTGCWLQSGRRRERRHSAGGYRPLQYADRSISVGYLLLTR